MVKISGYKIERPKTIFGKLPYPQEQRKIMNFTSEVSSGSLFINPKLVGIQKELFPVELMSDEARLKRINKHFRKAKKILKELGV